ncbi:uncharacterized protein [Brachyistius frenatus]|uniref:uncharacterized protein n=1 Tax=Brachyistius frenatus TaxID=100188 RepID=UPI0037E8A5A2
MPGCTMKTGRQKRQNVLVNGSGRDVMNASQFCFSCEQIFANRKCLEEHACPAASHICSCGTEFTEYKDMLEHSTTHEPGHQVLDHETIRKRRIEKHKEEEEKLKRLQKGEVVWKTPKLENVPSMSLGAKRLLQAPNTSAFMSQVPKQSAQISQVPELYPSLSQTSLLPNHSPSAKDMLNIFADVGSPTVDLWTLYQPVVLLQTVGKFSMKKPFTCGKCGQLFMTKSSLILHHSSHVTDKVSGCIGCGMLLSSKKLVPRFHNCNSTHNATKFRLITARPLISQTPKEAGRDIGQNLGSQGPEPTSLQWKKQNPSAAARGSQTLYFSSLLQFKSQSGRTYSNNDHGPKVTPPLTLKSWHPSASKPFSGVSFLSKSQSPNHSVLNPSSRGLSTMQLNRHTLGALRKPTETSLTPGAFMCRVCYIPFDTPQLLQRHKCVKAQEFMARHMRDGKQQYKPKRIAPAPSSNRAPINGERKFEVPSSGSVMKNQIVAMSLDEGPGEVPDNGTTDVDSDDDCYIVESGPDKPAEMIYQVTSTLPIKT